MHRWPSHPAKTPTFLDGVASEMARADTCLHFLLEKALSKSEAVGRFGVRQGCHVCTSCVSFPKELQCFPYPSTSASNDDSAPQFDVSPFPNFRPARRRLKELGQLPPEHSRRKLFDRQCYLVGNCSTVGGSAVDDGAVREDRTARNDVPNRSAIQSSNLLNERDFVSIYIHVR